MILKVLVIQVILEIAFKFSSKSSGIVRLTTHMSATT